MDKPDLPAHVEETVEAIATFHSTHEREMSRSQRAANRVVDYMGSNAAILWLTVAIALWVTCNLIGGRFGHALDRPPFSALQTMLSAIALYVTLIILRTQRHDDQVARRRERLTLQLAIVSDRKAAKIVALLEDIRRDSPLLADRDDPEAQDMSIASDPHEVLDALQQSDRRANQRTTN